MRLDKVDGFSCGWTGSSGRHIPSALGKKGQGRAATCRTYTVTVKRLSDGKTLSRTIGPAYWHKKMWSAMLLECQDRLIKELS